MDRRNTTPVPLVIIGASTGGTRVLPYILERIPPLHACVLIVQHMPAFITSSFARTLCSYTNMPVRLIQDRDMAEEGYVFVVPGDRHCMLWRNRRFHLSDTPKVNFVRPSIDVTMLSATRPQDGEKLFGLILTGMGQDGAAGLRHLKQIGATTMAQDSESCAVFGMPRQAIETGCVDHVFSPDQIATWLSERLG